MTGPIIRSGLQIDSFSGGGNGFSTNGWAIYKKDGNSSNNTTTVKIHDKTYTDGTERFELEAPKITASNGFVGNLTGNVTGNVSGNASTATALQSKSIGSATKPVYFDANGKPVAITHTIESNVPANAKFTDTNTTYTASNGVTLTGTNFTNSGVRAVSKGTTNGTISVNTMVLLLKLPLPDLVPLLILHLLHTLLRPTQLISLIPMELLPHKLMQFPHLKKAQKVALRN